MDGTACGQRVGRLTDRERDAAWQPCVRLPNQRNMTLRIVRRSEEPGLDRVAGRVISGSAAVWCRSMSSKNNTSPGANIGRATGDSPASCAPVRPDRPIEVRTVGAGFDDVVEAARNDVETGRVDSAVRKRQPDIQCPNVAAQERAVLMPAGVGVDRDAPEVHCSRKRRSLAEVTGGDLVQADRFERLQQREQHTGASRP